MNGFFLNVIGFVLNTTEFAKNKNGIVLFMTGFFYLNRAGLVPNMT